MREKETQVYEHVHGLIDRGIASGEFYEMRLACAGAGLHRDDARRVPLAAAARAAQRAGDRRASSATALLRGLIRDETIRVESPLGGHQAPPRVMAARR